MRKGFWFKFTAIIVANALLSQILFPTIAYALTSGPGSPEFSSFEPVATTDMVNVFSGDFTYNLPVVEIPGSEGGGYALSLSYHSGTSSEEEASWVGHGWTLNPGSINRGVRGLPDDYNGTNVKQYNKTRPNWSLSATHKLNFEFFSKEERNKNAADPSHTPQASTVSFGIGMALRYNNYQGFNRSYNFGPSFKGFGSLDMNISSSGITFSADVNPLSILNKLRKKDKNEVKVETFKDDKKTVDKKKLSFKEKVAKAGKAGLEKAASTLGSSGGGSAFGLFVFHQETSNVSVAVNKGYNLNYSLSLMGTPSQTPVGINYGTSGSFSMQYNIPEANLNGYGYRYSPTSGDDDQMSDYFVEKAQPFDKRDLFMGVPFSNADMFSLTGEGLSGGFRLHQQKTGVFYPTFNESKLKIYNLGFQLTLGLDLGVGLTFGFGIQKSKIRDWKKPGNVNDYQFNGSEPLLAFNSDLGSKIEYGNNAVKAVDVDKKPKFPGVAAAQPNIQSAVIATSLKPDENIAYYNEALIGRSSFLKSHNNNSGMEGFEILNADGQRYHYGNYNSILNGGNLEGNYTVHARKEASVSVDAINEPTYNNGEYVTTSKQLHLIDNTSEYTVEHCEHDVVVGEIKNAAYANTYLIREITTPEYVDDLTPEGASDGDFGGWTKFDYWKDFGTNNDNNNSMWYRWRAPYTGLLYQKNSISDETDDLASVSTGEREVYYLKKIETKTHIAYFVTNESNPARFGVGSGDPIASYLQGSGDSRNDGYGAKQIPGSSIDPASSVDYSSQGTEKMERLEKVILIAKANPDKPMKIVHFQYEYSLVPNLPNNFYGKFPLQPTSQADLAKSGKLTLVKVWAEYEGVVGAKISPYEFTYKYKNYTSYAPELITRYPQLNSFFNLSNLYSDAAQNPEYRPYLLDGWGYNQARGEEQFKKMRTGLYQGNILPQDQFDPAAWQLKQIKLPSGGQIMVEYEQKDYRYVQDRLATTLVSLKTGENGPTNKFPHFDLNLDDLGIDPADYDDYVTQLNSYYNEGNRHIFFKFLYALKDNNPNLNSCRSEYIDGYCKVRLGNGGPAEYINGNPGIVRIHLDGEGSLYGDYNMTPRQGCYDFYSTNRVGKYNFGCESDLDDRYDRTVTDIARDDMCENLWTTNIKQVIRKFLFATAAIVDMEVKSVMDLSIQPPLKQSVCTSVNWELSYLKVPVFKNKRGGGVRVKTLLMLDPGIETGDAVVYGSKYDYKTTDGFSSGVATTEPGKMHDECALTTILPKKAQSWLSRHIVGKDKEQSEGPLGESLLPGASIGHSRVVVSNIHTGITGTGYSVHQYITVRDYPFDKIYNYSSLLNSGPNPDINSVRNFEFATSESESSVAYTNLADNTFRDYMNLPTGIFNYSHKRLWAAQDFRFIINEMHGQLKSVKQYYGNTTDPTPRLSSSTEYEFFEPGEQVRVIKDEGITNTVIWDNPGKDMEVTMESKNIQSNSLDFGLSVDLSVGLIFWPPIFVTFFPSVTLDDNQFSTHVSSKVIRYPVIQKSVLNYKDGIFAKSENLAFDKATGKPILSRTTDSYDGMEYTQGNKHDGSYYSLNIPAYWKYPEMGPKHEMANTLVTNRTNQLSASAGSIVSYGANGNFLTNNGTWTIPTGTIVNSSANTYNQSRNYNATAGIAYWIELDDYGISNSNSVIINKLANIWRPRASYVYKTDVVASSLQGGASKIYDGGMYADYNEFNYADELNGGSITTNWIMSSQVTKYSPHGNALEEKNPLNVFSAAKYGYNGNTQPIMISQNANYSTIYFNDFEFDPGSANSTITAHSGKRSKQMLPNDPYVVAGSLKVNDHLKAEGAIIKLWTKSNSLEDPAIELVVNSLSIPVSQIQKVAQTGEWMLYSYEIDKSAFTPFLNGTSVSITITNSGTTDSFIDDIRFQPRDAKVTCYSYDVKNLKLITQFDDQHFGLYYQYNGEGKLVRKIIETERGFKTVQETQYNTPSTMRGL